ncbi:hypothetical protein SK128_012651 [Halocaridina rubra]|uniref:C2H2-type domain-containing protein n=1 Tax=Halocaridina rubra TaxID=373956 RepID=A0AAN8ZPN7_HALRR
MSKEMLRVPGCFDNIFENSTSDDLSSSTIREDIQSENAVFDSSTSKTMECHICHRRYKNRNSLATHIRVKHKNTLVARANMPCLEANCDFRGCRITSLITHLIRTHKKKFQCEKIHFQHEEEFWKWKKKAEETLKSTYSASSAAKKLAFGDKKLFLRCNRSGYTRYKSSTNAGSSSSYKSMKINAVCSSFMNVTFHKKGGASVFFCKTHYGHKDEHSFRCTRLSAYERNMMKKMILDGLTASEIISRMKTQIPEHRHHLLKTSSICNITARQNLPTGKEEGTLKCASTKKTSNSSVSSISCDFLIDLKVDNEIEIETGDEEPAVSSVIEETQNPTHDIQTIDGNYIKVLRNHVLEKAQQISRLALDLTLQELSSLNNKLSTVLKDIDGKNHLDIEILSDMDDSGVEYDENNLVYEDQHGHSVYLKCSNKDVNELSVSG